MFNITLLEAMLTVWPNNEGNKALSRNTWRMKCPEEGFKKFSCIPENLEGNTYELGPASSQEGPEKDSISSLADFAALCNPEVKTDRVVTCLPEHLKQVPEQTLSHSAKPWGLLGSGHLKKKNLSLVISCLLS